jgi:hypothetical protein
MSNKEREGANMNEQFYETCLLLEQLLSQMEEEMEERKHKSE